MIGGRAGLKDRFGLEGPTASRIKPPSLEGGNKTGHFLKIFPVVRPEIKSGALPRPTGDGLEKPGLKHPVFLVALLGPRIRKEHPNLREGDAGRERMQKLPGLPPDEMAIGQVRAARFAQAATDALAAHIHPEAVLLGKLRGVAREKVPVPAADLPDDGPRPGQQGGQPGAQRGTTLGDLLDKFRIESHPPNWRERSARCNPEAQAFWVRGSRNRMTSPCPSVLSAQTRPPWSCTMCLTMLRPSPVPPVSRERPFSTR